MRRALAIGGAVAATLSAGAAAAHPHVFYDAALRVEMDAERRLTAFEIDYKIDGFTSLYAMGELGVDPDGDGELTDAERATIEEGYRAGMSPLEYFVDLKVDGEKIVVGEPTTVTPRIEGASLAGIFRFELSEPLDLSTRDAMIKLYDDAYFTEVSVPEAPTLQGESGPCRMTFTPFSITAELAQAQNLLARLGREETPEQEGVGAIFADKTVISCRPAAG